MINQTIAPFAALLLRFSSWVKFLAHSIYLKAFVFTMPGATQFFRSLGLPGIFAYPVFPAEAVGEVMLPTTPAILPGTNTSVNLIKSPPITIISGEII